MQAVDLNVVRAGLRAGEFFLEYIPTMLLENNRCIGAEALVRWRHQGKLLLPEEFIPQVENTPASGLITYWVIEQVAQELGAWLRANDNIHLGINIPPEILGRSGVEYALTKAGLLDVLPKLLFEITERGIPDRLGLDELNCRSEQVRIALDDAGTAAENLILFSRVRIDMIKLDKSFADQLDLEMGMTTQLQNLSTLIQATHAEIIAEGVEIAAQVELLRQVGIKMAQGWYFSRPLLAQEFEEFFYTHQ